MSWELSQISRKLKREAGRKHGSGERAMRNALRGMEDACVNACAERDALRGMEGRMCECMFDSNVSTGRVESTDFYFCNSSSPADTHIYCSREYSLVKANRKGRTVPVPFLIL